MSLQKTLGSWLRQDFDIWNWYYASSLDGLMQLLPSKHIVLHKREIPERSHNIFSSTGDYIASLPHTILKASVRRTKRNRLWLIDTGTLMSNSPSPLYDSFESYILSNTHVNTWCFQWLDVPNDYGPLLQDIIKGDVWVVSNGSFQPSTQSGTAAWILEGRSSKLQITGKFISPGQAAEQSAYRSELAGLLAALTVINSLATFHNISSALSIHCNCETGLHKAFDIDTIPTIKVLVTISYKLYTMNYQGRRLSGRVYI
jgi:hypothetical protein